MGAIPVATDGAADSCASARMTQQDHGTRQLAALFLQQLRVVHGEHGHRRQHFAKPIGALGVERQYAAAGAAGQVKEQFRITPRVPVGDIVQHDQPDAPAPHVVGQLAAAVGRLLADVADIGHHTDTRRGERKDGDSDPAACFRLTDAERDWLDDFLGSDELLPEAMSLPCLDGFFTALVIGPEMVMPSEYLPEIWGTAPGTPQFQDSEQAEFVTGLLMRHWHTIAARIETCHPIMPLIRRHSLAIDVSEWAEGFMCGVALREAAWRTLFRDRQGASIVGLIASLGGEPDDEDAMAPPKEVTDAAEQLPEMVAAIAGFWQARRINPPPHRASKVGHNDLCPCGSGRKFKQCCGAPGRVLS